LAGTYDGTSSTYTTVAADALVTGMVYRFVYVAHNLYGDSAYSNPLIAGFGDSPPAPSAPTRNTLLSN
jgi:hypothetical protein